MTSPIPFSPFLLVSGLSGKSNVLGGRLEH